MNFLLLFLTLLETVAGFCYNKECRCFGRNAATTIVCQGAVRLRRFPNLSRSSFERLLFADSNLMDVPCERLPNESIVKLLDVRKNHLREEAICRLRSCPTLRRAVIKTDPAQCEKNTKNVSIYIVFSFINSGLRALEKINTAQRRGWSVPADTFLFSLATKTY